MRDRERWRNVRRAPGYRVSPLGRVRSPGGLLTPVPDKDGYLRVMLGGVWAPVTHLVLEAFVSPRPSGSEACHDPMRSEGRSDCRLEVLRWDSRRANERDKKRARKAATEVGTRPVLRRTSPKTLRTAVTLAEAVELGIISCSLVAARKAAQRPGFPPRVGLRGTSGLWDRAQLAAWEAR